MSAEQRGCVSPQLMLKLQSNPATVSSLCAHGKCWCALQVTRAPPHKVACMQDDTVDASLLDMADHFGHTVQQDEDGSPGDNEQAITEADCSAPPSAAGPVHITPPPTSRPIRPSLAGIGGLQVSAAGSEPSPVVTAGASGSQLGFAPRSGAYTEPVGLGGGAASQPLTRTCSRDSIQSSEKNELEAFQQVNPSYPKKCH